MRQRKIKSATTEELASRGVLVEPGLIRLKKTQNNYLEIGSGKGQFLTRLAITYPNDHFIAIEINKSVCYRLLEKVEAFSIKNLMIILADAKNLQFYIPEKSLDGIFLNFSDPWPKAKHHKRRLTAPQFLLTYEKLLKKDGFVQFRTDHMDLFNASVATISEVYELIEITRNLPVSDFMTEYEEKKRKLGPIYQVKARIKG